MLLALFPPDRVRHTLAPLVDHDANARRRMAGLIGALQFAVAAIEARYRGCVVPVELEPAFGTACAAIDAHRAGDRQGDGDVCEVANALADALHSLPEVAA
jgi:hypothetical protein